MKIATKKDKALVVDILSPAFADNQSVGHLVGDDPGRRTRIRKLMAYAFEECRAFGKVWLNEEGTACALVSFKDQKQTTLAGLWRDLGLIFRVMGFDRLGKVLRKEKLVERTQQEYLQGRLAYYIWFIGVPPELQGKGLGSALLNELLEDAVRLGRVPVLETSNLRNLAFYQQAGFEQYEKLDVGYPLYFFKRE
ncbi:MAG TPA: GNAT family N-acetyltransferase [Mucilaginibacter sp.]|nr:GNAT family N-acetyltransferase [Mucilaginibacter sp.]